MYTPAIVPTTIREHGEDSDVELHTKEDLFLNNAHVGVVSCARAAHTLIHYRKERGVDSSCSTFELSSCSVFQAIAGETKQQCLSLRYLQDNAPFWKSS